MSTQSPLFYGRSKSQTRDKIIFQVPRSAEAHRKRNLADDLYSYFEVKKRENLMAIGEITLRKFTIYFQLSARRHGNCLRIYAQNISRKEIFVTQLFRAPPASPRNKKSWEMTSLFQLRQTLGLHRRAAKPHGLNRLDD